MNKKALSLPEIIIAIALAVIVLVPVISIMSNSGRQTSKGQNYSFAAGLARFISQQLYVTPYNDIQDVAPISPCEPANNPYFVPFANLGALENTQTAITQKAFPTLYNFITSHNFKYALSVGEVFYTKENGDKGEMADGAKSVSIEITWAEEGRSMMYRTNVYVTSL